MVEKSVQLKAQKLEEAKKIAEVYSLSAVTARVLAARGFLADSRLKNFIHPSLKDGLIHPSELCGLKEAAEAIKEALNQKHKIAITCDFDVDGLTSAAQLADFLGRVGAEVQVFVPDRFKDGYGLSSEIIKTARQAGNELLICLDFGTHNNAELDFARTQGFKTIVIDHHIIGDQKCPADIFINPHRSDCGFADKTLCTAGLTWYLILALKSVLGDLAAAIDPREFLDLACLGTVCDMVPLIGVNRVITKRGLEVLTQSERPGIVALKEVAGVRGPVSCYDVSFALGPRINAAGRMVSGEVVVELLTTKDIARAHKLANVLHRLNFKRQEEDLKVRNKAIAIVEERAAAEHGIVVWGEEFHTGVVGIVAQRLVEKYHRPAIVLGKEKEGTYKGSVRGIRGVNVVEVLTSLKHLLVKFGGHESAGGVSLEERHLENFSAAFDAACEKALSEKSLIPVIECDTEVTLLELSMSVINEIKSLSPFGIGNPQPTVMIKDLTVLDVKTLKSEHLKAVFSNGKQTLEAVWWRQPSHPSLKKGAKVTVAFRADLNNFNGLTSIQANIQAIL
jgi:single-stranded-DNA-specific exonuclease